MKWWNVCKWPSQMHLQVRTLLLGILNYFEWVFQASKVVSVSMTARPAFCVVPGFGIPRCRCNWAVKPTPVVRFTYGHIGELHYYILIFSMDIFLAQYFYSWLKPTHFLWRNPLPFLPPATPLVRGKIDQGPLPSRLLQWLQWYHGIMRRPHVSLGW